MSLFAHKTCELATNKENRNVIEVEENLDRLGESGEVVTHIVDVNSITTSPLLPMEFSKIHLSKWAENESYIICLRFVKNLPVVNDCAERGVELVQDFYVTTRGCSLASSHGCLNNVGNGHSTPDTYEQSTSQSSQLHNK
ncbi:hypothetical protein PV325_008009 [Microctonus aethiopoides]|nr:hypothetical protein PV325_008009 [Microctonus aethiopoides]